MAGCLRDPVGLLQIRNLGGGNKEERRLEEGDRGGHGPQGPKRHKRSGCGVIPLTGDTGISLNRHLSSSYVSQRNRVGRGEPLKYKTLCYNTQIMN